MSNSRAAILCGILLDCSDNPEVIISVVGVEAAEPPSCGDLALGPGKCASCPADSLLGISSGVGETALGDAPLGEGDAENAARALG